MSASKTSSYWVLLVLQLSEKDEDSEDSGSKPVRSLSLESIHEMLTTGSKARSPESPVPSKPVSYNDASSRTEKLTQMLAAEGITPGQHGETGTNWEDGSASHGVKRADSFKRATADLNRVDSISVTRIRREKKKKSLMCSAGNGPTVDHSGAQGSNGPSSMECRSTSGGAKIDHTQHHISTEIISNPHTKSTNSLDNLILNAGEENEEMVQYDNVPASPYDNMGSPRVQSPGPESELDPWEPRSAETEEVRKRMKAKILARQHSMSSADARRKAWRKQAVLQRSNSLSSLSDSKGNLVNVEPPKLRGGLLRMPSDTLIFANRSAFLASQTEKTVKYDPTVQRTIARLATPPRELGPREMLKQIELSQERDRRLTRLSSPPRTFAGDSGARSSMVLVNSYTCDLEKEIFEALKRSKAGQGGTSSPGTPATSTHAPLRMRPPMLGNRPATMDLSSPAHASLWKDFEDYLGNSQAESSLALPQFPVPEIQVHQLAPRPDSFCIPSQCMPAGQQHNASSSPGPMTSSPSTPCNESLVNSLRHAVMNLTSKITGKSPRSVETSPLRSPRTKSTGALDQLGISTEPAAAKSPRHREKSKEKRKFVHQLARAYSDRVKMRNRERQKLQHEATMTKELTNLLKENTPGGSTIGERMAMSKPIVLGSYTLHRKRPARPKRGSGYIDSDVSSSGHSSREATPEKQVTLEVPTKGTASNHDSGCMEDEVFKIQETSRTAPTSDNNTTTDTTTLSTAPSQLESGPVRLPSDSCRDTVVPAETLDSESEQDEAYECYYEQKFAEDLETNLSIADEAFRDSAIYSDDGAMVQECDIPPKMSIRDTVKLIEHRYQARPVQKIQVKHAEKAQGFEEIKRTLESSISPLASPELSRRDNVSEKSLKSIRERTRELVECATLTRIRQNSCTVTDEPRMDASQPEHDLPISPASKGWVKHLIGHFEGESSC